MAEPGIVRAQDQVPPPAAAAAPLPPPSRQAAMMQLGKDFANKVGGDLGAADLYLSGAGKLELAEHASGTHLPDDEPLLLHGMAGKEGVNLPQDIYSIKRGKRLMISLGDFCSAAALAIKVNPSTGMAAGWFVRQDQTFSLDAGKGEVVIKGKAAAIDPKDIEASPNDILISSDLLEKWFGLDFTYDFANLALIIKSAQPLPAEAAYLRSQKGKSQGYAEGPAKLPFREQPYGLVSEPYIDTNIGGQWSHSPGGAPQKSGNWSTIMSGDLLGFNAQGFASGGLQKPYLSSLRGTMGKQDPDGKLLGPLHATSYSFGDINAVSSSIIGGGEQEQGITATNKPLNASTSATQTIIRGDAQPGWDVELYRNNSFIDIRHVGVNGLYDFGNVDLLGGDNDFKLVFYGPQGELREEHQHIGVNPNAVGAHTGYYAASLTRTGVATFQNLYGAKAPNYPGYGDPHLGASYEYGLGRLGTATFGLRTNHGANGNYGTYAQGGLASYFLDTYLNGDVGYEADNSATSEALTARRNFGQQSALVQYTANSLGYNIVSSTLGATGNQNQAIATPGSTATNAATGAAIRDSIRTSLSGPLMTGKFLFINRLNYNLSGTYTDLYGGGSQVNATSSLSTSIKAISITGGLTYNRNVNTNGLATQQETMKLNSRGPFHGGTWRLTSQYQLVPVRQLTEDDLEYNHSLGPNLDSTTSLTYTPNPKLTTGKLSLNWQTSRATVSPSVSADSNHNIIAGVNVHFGAGADPYSHIYSAYNAYISTAGGVAARIFLDKNGDGVYDEGDELMPDVEIRALQAHREAASDAKGIAFIPDIPQNLLTDVSVDQGTFKDSYDLSLFKGVSIRTHPGSVTRIEFPVVVGGGMDGQANYADAKKGPQPARNLTVSLIAPDGEVEKNAVAANDGYWSIDLIRPGIYYLVAQTDASMSAGYMTPRLMEFKASGTTDFGQAVTLTPGYNIAFIFRSENAPPDGDNHARVLTPEDVESQRTFLDLGHFHSRLTLTLEWYRFKMRSPHWDEYFNIVTPVSKIPRDPKTGDLVLLLKPKTNLTMDRAALACQKLQDMKFDCAVEVITRYRPARLLVAVTNGVISGGVSVAVAAVPAQPLPGLHLGLYDSDGRLAMTAVSTGDGRYVFSNVHSGHYLLMADGRDAQALRLLRPAPEFIDIGYGSPVTADRNIILNSGATGAPVKDVPVSVRTNLGDYAAVNPALDKSALKDKVVVLNLGSYNSRELMVVIWYKLHKRYAAVIGPAHLLVQPAESYASPRTGKNVLRVALPGYDVKDAWGRCHVLTSAGEYCAVEIMPKGWQELSAADTPPKG